MKKHHTKANKTLTKVSIYSTDILAENLNNTMFLKATTTTFTSEN